MNQLLDTLRAIEAMDPEGQRADDLGRAAALARDAVRLHRPPEPIALVRMESAYWNRGHFHEGRRKTLETPSCVQGLPVGTKLYAILEAANANPR